MFPEKFVVQIAEKSLLKSTVNIVFLLTLTNKCGILKLQQLIIRILSFKFINLLFHKRYNLRRNFLNKRKGESIMLNDKICKLRDKLNKSIENGENYEVIYNLSVELDELIAQFYKEKDMK